MIPYPLTPLPFPIARPALVWVFCFFLVSDRPSKEPLSFRPAEASPGPAANSSARTSRRNVHPPARDPFSRVCAYTHAHAHPLPASRCATERACLTSGEHAALPPHPPLTPPPLAFFLQTLLSTEFSWFPTLHCMRSRRPG